MDSYYKRIFRIQRGIGIGYLKVYLTAPGPLDGKDNDALVVQILKGQTSIAKQKVFSTRRALLRKFCGYARGHQLLASRVFVTHTQRLQVLQTADPWEVRGSISFNL